MNASDQVKRLVWSVSGEGGVLAGLAVDRETAIALAQRSLGYRPGVIANSRTGEVWRGSRDQWERVLGPQRLSGQT